MLFNLGITEVIGILAGIISLVGYIPYIYSILKHATKPSRSSWWIWSFVGFLILLSYYQVGARNTLWIPLVFFICPLIIAVFSVWYGEGRGLNKLDKICLFLAAGSLIPWILFKSAEAVFYMNIGIDFLGYLPTLRKTYQDSKSENHFTWILFFVGSMLNIMALENYNFSILLYPVYMFIMDVIMMYLIFARSFIPNKNKINK